MCLRAAREPGEAFAGSLTQIRGDMAYWVHSPTLLSPPIRVTLDLLGKSPSPRLHAGWNLVPIIPIAPVDAGIRLDADSAFGTAIWTVAFSFVAQDNRWEKLDSGEGATVVVGRGYWLWVVNP